MPHVDESDLTAFAEAVFLGAGLSGTHARLSAEALVFSDLRGSDSHGVSRLPTYVEAVRRGVINPRPDVRIEPAAPASARVDGDNGIGLAIGCLAMDHAVDLAQTHGIGVVTVRRSNHFGAAAFPASRAMASGCIGMAMSNASPTMAAWGGVEPVLGTNPIAFGVPGTSNSFLLDMATSVVARGRFRIAQARGETIPKGWAISADGRPALTPEDALDGTVLPFGGAKGSGLSMFVDILSGVLSGAGYGRNVHNMYEQEAPESHIGHFFLAIDIAPLMPIAMFDRRFSEMTTAIKNGKVASTAEEILIPGERGDRMLRQRRAGGIPVPSEVADELARLGGSMGVPLPPGLQADNASNSAGTG